jgi:hypothetical protein
LRRGDKDDAVLAPSAIENAAQNPLTTEQPATMGKTFISILGVLHNNPTEIARMSM